MLFIGLNRAATDIGNFTLLIRCQPMGFIGMNFSGSQAGKGGASCYSNACGFISADNRFANTGYSRCIYINTALPASAESTAV